MVGDVPLVRPAQSRVEGGLYQFSWGGFSSKHYCFAKGSAKMNPDLAMMMVNTADKGSDTVNAELGSCLANGTRRPCIRLLTDLSAGDFVNVKEYARTGTESNTYFRKVASWSKERRELLKKMKTKQGTYICEACMHTVHPRRKATHNFRCEILKNEFFTAGGFPQRRFRGGDGKFDLEGWLKDDRLVDPGFKGRFKINKKRKHI